MKNAIRIHGLDEVTRGLGELAEGLEDALSRADQAVADQVAQDARSKAFGLGGVAAKAAPSIQLQAGPDAPAVAIGGNAYPFAAGAEFGSLRYPQFEPWRGSEGGYFLYPAIREGEVRHLEIYEDETDDLIRRAGL